MSLVSGIRDFFGLDIGTTAIRVVQLTSSGQVKSLVRYGYMPIDDKISESDSAADRQKVAQSVKQLLASSGITSKNVAVGLPSQRVFTTLVDIDKLSESEIAQTIQLQADAIVPTPLSESKIDWAVVGDSPNSQNKVEILLSSVSNDYVENRLDMLETIGLNVIAFEPENLAIVRALMPPESTGMNMVIDIGNRTSDIVVSLAGSPRLTRSISTGTDSINRAAMQNLNIDAKQAEQFVSKFGLSKDKLEGQIHSAIIGTVDILIGEVEKSVKFITSRYPNTPLEKIIVTGGAATLPEFPVYLANKFNIAVEVGNSWRNIAFPAEKQNELLALSNHFAVATGLAGRNE